MSALTGDEGPPIPTWMKAAAGAAILGVAVWLAIDIAGGADEDLQRAREAEAAYEAVSDTLDTMRDSLEAALAREDSLQRRLRAAIHRLDTLNTQLATSLDTDLDVLAAFVPDSAQYIVERAQARVDSMEATFDSAQATWQRTFKSQQRQIAKLQGMWEKERDARLQAEGVIAQYEALADPAWYTEFGREVPEILGKTGGAVLSCLVPKGENRLYSCGSYLLATGIDVAFQ